MSVQISYTITRDGREVGFGSSGDWNDVDAALYAVQSDIQNRMWETAPGMPEPDEIDLPGEG